MSDTNMFCPKCGEPSSAQWTLCGPCAGEKQEVRAMQEAARQPQRTAVPVGVTWRTLSQKATKVSKGGNPLFKNHYGTLIEDVMTCLAAHAADARSTDRDEEQTIWDNGDTMTVDYQGTRAGTQGSLWIDLQGQKGSKGPGRYTYWQIMVEVHAGSTPPQDMVLAAIRASAQGFKEGSGRVLIHHSDKRPV